MISAAQCRMARAGVQWSTDDLARAAQVGRSTVMRFETGKAAPIASTAGAIQRALEAAGVRFTEHGVDLPPGGAA